MKSKHQLVVTREQIVSIRHKFPSYQLESQGKSRAWSNGGILINFNDSKKYTDVVMKLEKCGFKVDEE